MSNPQRSFPRAMAGALFLMSSSLIAVSMLAINVQPDLSDWNDQYFATIAALLAGPHMRAVVSAAASVALFANLLAQHLCASQALCFASQQGWASVYFSETFGENETPRFAVVGTGCAVALLQFVPLLSTAHSGTGFELVSKIWFLLYSVVIVGLLATFFKLRLSMPVSPTISACTLSPTYKSEGESQPLFGNVVSEAGSMKIGGAVYGATATETDLTDSETLLPKTTQKHLYRPFVALGPSLYSAFLLCIPPLLIVAANFWFFLQGRISSR